MEKSLVKIDDNWYQKLIFDLKLLNFEGIVKTKHAIGKRIIEDELKFEKAKYGNRTIQNLADDLDVDKSELYRCVKFAKKYPELEKWNGVPQLSWRKIIHNLLPEKPHVSQATGENEWNTPSEYIESARLAMGSIDVDPASNEQANEIIKAETFYTAEDEGRDKSWHGNVWMNPPYSQPIIADFCEAIVKKYQSNEIRQACVLVNNATETAWFQGMLEACRCVCFLRGRVRFIDKQGNPSGAPLQGQAVLYFGEQEKDFAHEFSKFGIIVWRE